MHKRTLAILFTGLLHALSTYANNDEEVSELLPLSLEELMDVKVSISTNTQKTLSRAPAVVSLITAEDIKNAGATNLTEALQGVPGVYIRTNLFGFRPWVYVRGSGSANVLLMVNGAPIKEFISSSGQYWKGLPVSMIERIEIIRGPGSALYGSDASSGVINVITKTAGKINQSEAGVRVGSFDSQTTWLQHGTSWNGFDINFTAELLHTGGNNPLIEKDKAGIAGRASNGYDNADLRFSIAQGNWRLLADHTQKSNLAIGLTGGAYLDPLTRGSDSQTNLALLYKNATFAQDWGLEAELRYRDSAFSSGNGYFEQPPNPASIPYPDGKINQQRGAESRLNFELSGLYTGFRNHAIRLGGGYVKQDQYQVEQFVNYLNPNTGATLAAAGPLLDISDSPYAFLPKKARTNSYLFLQDVWNFAADWELTVGGRYDNYSDFGGAFNPRLALVWQTTDRLTTKLMYGEAFRAPSYGELYAHTATSIPNAALLPESSKTSELGFSYLATRDLKLGFNYYQFIQSNIIATDSTTTYQNTGELTSSGIELEALWQATKTLRLSGSLTDRKEDAPNVRSFNVPKQQAYLRADWAFQPKWHWNLQANWLSKHIYSTRDITSQPLGAYTLADTTLRYVHDKQWEFSASMRNLFDKDVREYVPTSSTKLPYNLPLPRRNVYAEIPYKF